MRTALINRIDDHNKKFEEACKANNLDHKEVTIAIMKGSVKELPFDVLKEVFYLDGLKELYNATAHFDKNDVNYYTNMLFKDMKEWLKESKISLSSVNKMLEELGDKLQKPKDKSALFSQLALISVLEYMNHDIKNTEQPGLTEQPTTETPPDFTPEVA